MRNLKQALNEGHTIIGTSVKTPSPALVEIVGYAGFDFIWLDTEHSPYDVDTTEALIRGADAVGVPCLVRVPDNIAVLIGKALDYGAQGVVVPHISTADDAHRAVQAAYYPPFGSRSGSPTVRSAHYGMIPWSEYVARSQEETLLVLQIEGKEGIARLDEIMDVPGADVLFIGSFDLAASLGVSGQFDHPLLLDTVSDIVQRAKAKGIRLGIWMPTPEHVGPWAARGVQFITVANSDTVLLEGCRSLASRTREQINASTQG